MMHRLTIAVAIAMIGLAPAPATARKMPVTFPAVTGDALRVAFDRREPRPGVRLLEITRTRSG